MNVVDPRGACGSLIRNKMLTSKLNSKTGEIAMTYVASPSHPIGDPARAKDLKRCLETARKYLDETSSASDTEKREKLVSSAVDAGWGEDEARTAIASENEERAHEELSLKPSLGVIPSSSL